MILCKVGSNARTVMTTAKTTLLGEEEVDEALAYPNRALGGVLAIELSGCIIEVSGCCFSSACFSNARAVTTDWQALRPW